MNSSKPSMRVARGNVVLNTHLLKIFNQSHHNDSNGDATELPPRTIPALKLVPPNEKGPNELIGDPICIIGAGAAGLFAGMALVTLGIKDFIILEASDRVGGRAYTYQFPKDDQCTHNYYDMGAMRIPDITSMQPTIDLVNFLIKKKYPLSLESYIYDNSTVPSMYYYAKDIPNDTPFTQRMMWLLVEFGFSTAKTQEQLEQAFENYFKDPHNFDSYSCRAWMMTSFPDLQGRPPNKNPLPPPLTYEQTQVGEMMETSSGLLDQALTEMMIDFSDFQDAKDEGVPWYRVQGKTNNPDNPLTGMSALTDAMRQYIIDHGGPDVTKNSPVVQLSENSDETITVTYGNTVAQQKSANYSYVICTTALGCLQRMDLSGLNLSDEVLVGIRTLSYDRATKVAIKFSEPWWLKNGVTGLGGVSGTDLPISNVVYPSWDDGEQNYILMASYSWAQDATRMASLVPDYPSASTNPDDPIVTLCLQNLAKLFGGQVKYEYLRDKYIAHHAWSWSHDPWTAGAFALFGPGQFENIYRTYFSDWLCNGKLLICGEALSVHHAWISGAIDSVYIKTMQFALDKLDLHAAAKLKDSELGGGKGQNPAELNETTLRWSVDLKNEKPILGKK